MSLQQPAEQWKPIPIRFTRWLKGFPDVPNFGSEADPKNMVTFRILGERFTGKSALLEAICSHYFCNGSTIYDVFGANDNEMLAWLDSPYKDRVTLIHGNDLKIDTNIDTIKIADLHPKAVPEQRIYVTSRAFYRKRADDFHYYSALYQLTRRFRDRDSFNRTDMVAIREADEFISSVKASGGQGVKKPQVDAEVEFARFHNQMVHYGFALGIDQHRDVDVAKKVRYLYDYLFMKNMGNIELPRPWWPLRYFDPDRLLRRLKPNQFAVQTNSQCLAVGTFDLPSWHIKRGSGLLAKFGIRVIDKFTGEVMTEEAMPTSGKGIVIDDDTKAKVFQLAREGKSQTEIAAQMGISQPAISKMLSKARENS